MINLYFQIAAILFGIHNYAALNVALGQRLMWCWHLIQWLSIGLFVYSGLFNNFRRKWMLIVLNILLGGFLYSIILHGLKYLQWKIPIWF